MRGLTTGLLACCLASLVASPVVAEEPSPAPPPWFGGRVEIPEHGYAVTIPEDWAAFDMTADDETQTQVISRVFGAALQDLMPSELAAMRAIGAKSAFLVAGGFDAAGDWVLEATVESRNSCLVSSVGIPGPLAIGQLEEAAAAFQEMLATAGAGDPLASTPTVVDLLAGTTIAVDLSYELDHGPVSGTVYLVASDQTLLFTICGAPDPPDDRWLSIAESIEFLPEEER